METELLRKSAVARRLSVAESTVDRWMKREERTAGTGIRFVRLPGGERRVPASEVDRIVGEVTK